MESFQCGHPAVDRHPKTTAGLTEISVQHARESKPTDEFRNADFDLLSPYVMTPQKAVRFSWAKTSANKSVFLTQLKELMLR